jgi:hypothetical protein
VTPPVEPAPDSPEQKPEQNKEEQAGA